MRAVVRVWLYNQLGTIQIYFLNQDVILESLVQLQYLVLIINR